MDWRGDVLAERPARQVVLLAGLGYLGLSVLLFASTWVAPFTQVIGAGPDPGLFIWYLRWVPFAVSHGLNPLLSNYLDYPDGINVMWQTSTPFLGAALAPLTVTAGPMFAYNLAATLMVALSAWCAFLAIRRLVRHPLPAGLGGLLYGFSPYMLAQGLGHLHLAAAFVPPLMVVLLDEIAVRQRRAAGLMGVGLGLLGAAQFLLSEELLATEVVMGALVLALLAASHRELISERLPYALRALGIAFGVFVLLAGGPLGVQFFGPQRVQGFLPVRNVFVSDLLGFAIPTPLQLLTPGGALQLSERFSGTQYESNAYLGLPLIALAAFTAARFWSNRLVQLATLVLMAAAGLSLGVTLHIGGMATGVPVGLCAIALVPLMRTPAARVLPVLFLLAWAGFALLPMLDNVVPSRLMLYAFLAAGFLLAFFVQEMLRSGSRRASAMSMLFASVVLLSLFPRLPYPTIPAQTPAFFRSAAVEQVPEGSVALVLPYARGFHPIAMLWQAESGMRFRMPEGYANRPGPSEGPAETTLGNLLAAIEVGVPPPPLTPGLEDRLRADLRAWRVKTVLIGPMDHQAEVIELFSTLFRRPPAIIGGVSAWWQVEG